MKLNVWTVSGLIYITMWVTFAIANIGNVYECEPNHWTLPIKVFFVFSILFGMGYMGGKK